MRKLISVIVLVAAIEGTSVYGAGFSWVPSKIEIECEKTAVKVGEPLLLKVRFVWPQAMVNPKTGSVRKVVSADLLIMVRENETTVMGVTLWFSMISSNRI